MEKQTCEFLEIPLVEIGTDPRNPRKHFSGQAFDELVASVKEKGVIEPIIVRPMGQAGMKYRIVAGERRFHAAEKLGHETIPAIVRKLTDEQAFDFMLIENLQREDLTELEEAQSFKLYVGKHGEKGIAELAEKTGIAPRYIRRRMAVLKLPAEILKAWEKDQLEYGHLEQLLRVKDSPEELKGCFREAMQKDRFEERMSVKELRGKIDFRSPVFKKALFPFEKECAGCPKNSIIQHDLFGVGDPAAGRCLDPECFKKRQNDWLQTHWKETALHKQFGTTGFRFRESVSWNDHETVYHPTEKCKSCPHFLTIIDVDGELSYGDGRQCFKKACLHARERKAGDEELARKKPERKPGEPRVAWHGEYFRDLFLERRLPEVMGTFDPEDEKIKTLLLVVALHGNTSVREAIGKKFKISDAGWGWRQKAKLYAMILGLPFAEVEKIIPEAVKSIVMEGPHVGDGQGFGTSNRYAAAQFLGIDLSREWAMTEEYLQKKTKAEILEFGKKLRIFADAKAKDYLTKKFKGRDVDKLKKGELVDLVLKSGIDLVGKVPAEILKEAK